VPPSTNSRDGRRRIAGQHHHFRVPGSRERRSPTLREVDDAEIVDLRDDPAPVWTAASRCPSAAAGTLRAASMRPSGVERSVTT
jgi:hypothetical protein